MKEFSSISLEANVIDVKNVKEIKKTKTKIDNLKKLMPKHCDCGWPGTLKPTKEQKYILVDSSILISMK